MKNKTKNINFSEYKNIFCDSLDALENAYQNGLPHDSIVRTSSPAMLWKKKPNIVHIESCWNVNRMKVFQSTIQKFTEDIYDSALMVSGVSHEEALCVSQAAKDFQTVLFKAACLEEDDFTSKRLFLKVDGNGGPNGNNMNAPWDRLLSNNKKFSVDIFTLDCDYWSVLNTNNVTIWKRIRIGGIETIIYRIVVKLTKYLPEIFFNREALVVNESELIIETAAKLALNGVRISEISPIATYNTNFDDNRKYIIKSISPIVVNRIKQWVTPSCVSICTQLFNEYFNKQLELLYKLTYDWRYSFSKKNIKNRIVLINMPGTIKGQALSITCKELNIPIISTQHGVSVELSKLHGEVSAWFEDTVSDCVLVYNKKIGEIEKKAHFSKGKSFVVGMSERHMRMKSHTNRCNDSPDIVYISTNLYMGNMGGFLTWLTDYDRAKLEKQLLCNVFSKLPHRVRYKTYPEDNRRYADLDPVINENYNNIEIFHEKIDMRYLLSEHRVLVTSVATSTLGWPVMSGKPVIFINCKNNSPLTEDSYISLSKGMFVFNDSDYNFHKKLREFLSQPIEEIEELWEQKAYFRENMIVEYFSAYKSNAGSRAANMILKDYLSN